MITAQDIVKSIEGVPFIEETYMIEDELTREFLEGIGKYDAEALATRLLVKPVRTWICTDTEVGMYAFFLDFVFVGFGCKWGRKSDMEFSWVNEGVAKRVAAHVFAALAHHPEFEFFATDTDFTRTLESCAGHGRIGKHYVERA